MEICEPEALSGNFRVGVDIEDIGRFKKLDFDKNENFYRKIFCEEEINYCLSKKNPYQSFAARFCAKEAFIKALDGEVPDRRDIVVKVQEGKPFIEWDGVRFAVSLSHEKDKAIAFVVISRKTR